MAADDPSLSDPLTLLELAPCGLVVTREDGTIVRANQTFCHWTGFEAAALIGRRFQEMLTMGGRIFYQTHWAPLMQMQGSVAEVKLDLIHHDKRIITMLLNGVRREDASGAFYQLALFGTTDRDSYERELLTARKIAENLLSEKTAAELALQQAQEQLNLAYKKSQRRASFAEQMVAIVSHDLKNPLTAIKMASDLLVQGERTAKEAKLLGHISRSADRAERMIADLLDFAVARVGRGIAINPSPVDLHTFVNHSVEELRVVFPQAKLIHRSISTGSTRLDADRVQQVIGNLVANSVAYGDLAQPITVTSRLEDDQAVVSVHNEGPVIPESSLAILFEPMTRGTEADGESESDLRSVGLGLFIVKEIAAAHGGNVSVSSAVGDGTQFCVCLPVVGEC